MSYVRHNWLEGVRDYLRMWLLCTRRTVILTLARSCFLHSSSLSFHSPDCSSPLWCYGHGFLYPERCLQKIKRRKCRGWTKAEISAGVASTWEGSIWRTTLHSAIKSRQAGSLITLWHPQSWCSTLCLSLTFLSWNKCVNRIIWNEKEPAYHD